MAYVYDYARLLKENGYKFCHENVEGFDKWYTHEYRFGEGR